MRGIAPLAVGGQCRPKGGGEGRCKDGEQKKNIRPACAGSRVRAVVVISLVGILPVIPPFALTTTDPFSLSIPP